MSKQIDNESLCDALAEASKESSSPMYAFFIKNFDFFEKLRESKQIKWEDISKIMVTHGITTANGAPPNPGNTRKAWFKVRRKIARTRKNDPSPQENDLIKIERKPKENDRATDEAIKTFSNMIGQAEGLPTNISFTEKSQDSYIGPRPKGLPDNIPLTALAPLTATARTPDGKNFDYYENMPGYPRLSYFDLEIQWAKVCWAIGNAKPNSDLTNDERRFLDMLARIPGIA